MARYKGGGTQLWIADNTTPTPQMVKVKQCFAGNQAGGSPGEIDVSDFDSQAREYLQGIADEGTVSFQMNYDPNDPVHELLRERKYVGNTEAEFDCEIRLTQAATPVAFKFRAYVQDFPIDFGGFETTMTVNLTLRVNGNVTKENIT